MFVAITQPEIGALNLAKFYRVLTVKCPKVIAAYMAILYSYQACRENDIA